MPVTFLDDPPQKTSGGFTFLDEAPIKPVVPATPEPVKEPALKLVDTPVPRSPEELGAANAQAIMELRKTFPGYAKMEESDVGKFITEPLVNLVRRFDPKQMADAIDVIAASGIASVRSPEMADRAWEVMIQPSRPPNEAVKVAAAVGNVIGKGVNSMTSPLGIVTLGQGALPSAGQRIVSGLFAADMARHVPELAQAAGAASVEGNIEQKVEAVGDLLLNSAMIAGVGSHATVPERIKQSRILARELLNAPLQAQPKAVTAAPVEARVPGERPVSPDGVTYTGDFKPEPLVENPKLASAAMKILIRRGVEPDIAEDFARWFSSRRGDMPLDEEFRAAVNKEFDAAGLKSNREANTYSSSLEALEQNGITGEDAINHIGAHVKRRGEIEAENRRLIAGITQPFEIKGEPDVGKQSAVAEVPGSKAEDLGLPKGEAGKPAVQEAAGTSAEAPLIQDIALEKTLTAEMSALVKAKDYENPRMMSVQQEIQNLKNKYQGRKPSDVAAEKSDITNEPRILTKALQETPVDFEVRRAHFRETGEVLPPKPQIPEPSPATGMEAWADTTIQRSKSLGVTPVLGPELLAAYSVKGAAMLSRGVKSGAEWTEAMAKEHGDSIRPHLEAIGSHIESDTFKQWLHTPTEREVTRIEQAGSAVASLPNVRAFVDKVTTDPDLERLARNPFVKRHLIEPVLKVRESEAALAEPAVNYVSLKADPRSMPEMVSNAAGRALRSIESFNYARSRFTEQYGTKRASMVAELGEVLGERVEAVTARDAANASLDFIRERGRREIAETIAAKRKALTDATVVQQRGNEIRMEMAEDTAALKAFQTAMGQKSAVRNILEFVGDIDMSAAPTKTVVSRPTKKKPIVTEESGKPITTTKELIEAMERKAANQMVGDKTFEQVVQAPIETIRTIARLIVASEPIRAQLEANREAFGKPVEPFRIMRQEINAALKANDVQKAARIMASGVGKTAVDRAASAKLARVLGSREKRLIESITALDQAKAAIDTVGDSGEFKGMATEVFGDLGMHTIMSKPDGVTHVLKGIREGEPNTVISFDLSKLNAEQTIAQFRDYKDRAMSYLSDPAAKDYKPEVAAGLKAYLREYDFLTDPSIFPQRGRFVSGLATAIPRTIFGWFGGVDQIPRFVIRQGNGLVANHAHRTLTAFDTAKEVTMAKYFDHLARLQGTLSAALKTHGMTPDEYRVNILNPLAASRQDFRTAQLKAGDNIGNGHVLTGADVNYFKTLIEYEKAVIAKLTATARENFSVIADNPSGILYKDAMGNEKYRLPFETGPNTTNRRAEKAVMWARKWAGLDAAGRERFIDAHVSDMLFGYFSDATNPALSWQYKYGPEFTAILEEAKSGRPVESLEDLVDRTFDLHLTRAELPMAPELVKRDIVSEIGNMLKKVADEDTAGVNKSKVKIMAYGWENSFNTERGKQIIPSGWYDYGEVTAPEHAAFMNSALTKFAIEHLNAVIALDTVLKDTMTGFRDQVGDGKTERQVKKESRAKQLSGEDFYTWDEARVASNQVSSYLNKLQAALNFQKRASLIEANMDTSLQTGAQFVTASLLSGTQANVMNTFGGAFNMALFERAIRNHSIAHGMLRTAWHEIPKRAVREVIGLLAHEGNPVGRKLYSLLRHAETIPLAGRLAGSLGRVIDGHRALYDQGRRDGIILNKELGALTDSMVEFSEMGGVVEGRPPATMVGKLGKKVETRVRTGTKRLGQATVGYVDARINSAVFRLSQEMAKDLENRAWRYLQLRDTATPFGTSDHTNPATQMSSKELVGGRLKDVDVDPAAMRIREFLRDRAGINLDAVSLDYYRRRQTETPDNPARMFTDSQMRQIRMGMASWINLATFGNRPIAFRTGPVGQNLGLFLGYPAHELALLLSLGNRLSTRTWLRGRTESLPLILGMVAAATVIGSIGGGTAERLKRLLQDRESTAPTIFNSNNPAQMRDALIGGFASMVPFYGSIMNNITGNGLRNGFDLNSQFVSINFATDLMKFAKEVFQTGDGTVPSVRLAERYAFPANYLARFFPQYEGLREIANDRNLLIRNAKDVDLETMVRPPDSSPTRYTPVSPLLNEFANAVGKGDIGGAQAAYQKVVAYKAQEGSQTPEADALKAVQSRNPVSQVFRSQPTEQQMGQILGNMAPEDRARVERTLNNFSVAVQTVGGNEVNFAKSEAVPAGASGGSTGTRSGFGRLAGFGGTRRGRLRTGRIRRPRRARVGRTRRAPRIRRRR